MAEKNMSRFESPCTKYIYDPEASKLERNIPPGTPFEDLPEDWCCPLCGAEKETLRNWTTSSAGINSFMVDDLLHPES